MTNEQLADALGVNVRTIERDRRRGLPLPGADEALADWVTRAKAWRQANRRKPGPRPAADGSAAADVAMTRFRIAKAELAELQLAERRGELHSQKACEAERVARFGEVAMAMLGLGQAVARKCAHQTAEVVLMVVNEEVRRRLQVLADGGLPDDPDSHEPAEPGGAKGTGAA
jgi:phage terminase Nu1 subunit (DNA packaging protein)